MSFGIWLGLFHLLSAIYHGQPAVFGNGQHIVVECRDRYLSILTCLSFAGNAPRIEAVDALRVYPITSQYASECGYTLSTLPDYSEIRASYFSCHTDNQNDEVFTFKFNLIATNEDGEEVTHVVAKTCSVPLPWSPREVVCEENYMEVSVRSDVSCPSGTSKDDWNEAVTTAFGSATSDWQVMFQTAGKQQTPMFLDEARKLGYLFDMTAKRLLLRSPYGQPQSFVTKVGALSVEVIHPTLYSRQNWVVMMVDLVAACSMHEGSYDGVRLVWETPILLPPLVSDPSRFESRSISMGVDGQLLYESTMTEKGYNMDVSNTTVQIGIPFNAEGGYRKSFVMDNMYHQFYVVSLYYEHVFVTEDDVETRLRLHRQMATPLLPWPVFTINQTVLEDHVFTVSLDVPSDVRLSAVNLNGQEFTGLTFSSPFDAYPSYQQLLLKEGLQREHFDAINCVSILNEPRPNNVHAYIIRVPWEDTVVSKLHTDNGILEYSLDINYTLVIMPQEDPYYHLASVKAELMGVFPPHLDGLCSEDGIDFKVDHHPFDYMWEVGVGPYPLTTALATRRGYVLQNNSQSLVVHVPLYAKGYNYEDVGLKQFFGTFEILVRDATTSEVKGSSTKRCPFQTSELIVCSTDGEMTVVTNLTKAIHGAEPARTTLLKKTCRPIETDDSRVLFQFALNTCGTTVTVNAQDVIYENEIVIPQTPINGNPALRVVVQCVYPLSGLYLLFAERKFESETPGLGNVVYLQGPRKSQPQTQGLVTRKSCTMKPGIKGPIKSPSLTRKSPTTMMPSTVAPTTRHTTTAQTTTAQTTTAQTTTAQTTTAQTTTAQTTTKPLAKHPAVKYVRVVSGKSNFDKPTQTTNKRGV